MKYAILAIAVMLSVLPACADMGFCQAASASFYGGSSGYGGSSASSSISADLSALLSMPDSGSSVDVTAAKQSISGNLAAITSDQSTAAGSSLTANLNTLISATPATAPALPSIGEIGGRISAGFGSLAGGSSASSGSGSPSVSSPCPGVSFSSLPASPATYAAVHG